VPRRTTGGIIRRIERMYAETRTWDPARKSRLHSLADRLQEQESLAREHALYKAFKQIRNEA
jgi:hypothetical protein